MRRLPGLLLALLVLLSGCSVGFQPESGPIGPDPTATPTPTPHGDPGVTPTPDSDATPTPAASTDLPDPASDVLGWEDGYWHNESLSVNQSDGLNQTELRAVVARSMARVEVIRELEFKQRVPVDIVLRSAYQNRSSPEYSEAFRTFDNTKFESLFLIGEDRDALAVQEGNRGSSVLGFYSPANDSIVIIADSETPQFSNELTLGHELVHAAQDQYFDLGSFVRPTREAYNAKNGLIEGDANYVQSTYRERCESEWECLRAPSGGGGGGGDFHLGVYILNYFPYSDGPGFVKYFERRGGWERVDELYAAPPASTEQVIDPPKYGTDMPTDVTLTDRTANGWERVVPEPPSSSPRPPYAVFGQSGVATMFAYTLYDPYNRSAAIAPDDFLNREGGSINRTDPFNYDIAPASGWDGDRLHIYEKDGEAAYVWKLVWDSPSEAEEFADAYGRLLSHYGGAKTGPDTYVIDSGPYADAFRVTVSGDTVVIVNAPTTGDLDDVRR
ncbi:Hvo_1808 family surface protein [Natronomonas sp. EA1]|uniref:Hvo_1808 family surface protein n=1 Tax=Natronomonas sp. EA1 TaxID=3421655 RepID=UPI003EBD8135